MMKYLVEGASALSMDDAMTQAMRGAAEHLSENSDILISLVERKVRRGTGCHIALEVTSLPPGSQGRERAPRRLTAKETADEKYRQQRQLENATAWKKRIVDHFRRRMGVEANSARIHLENLQEFAIMGQIEREFFNLAHAVKPYLPEEPASESVHVDLRTGKPE